MVELEYRLFRGLLLQLHRLAGDADDAAGLVTRGVARRDHFQTHQRAFRAADQLDHFIQTPADHVDHFLVALRHADDLVGGVQLLALFRRACRHQAHHLDVFVVVLQHGTDTLERQAHVDIEVFRVVRRQVVGVRVVGLGKGVDVGLEHVLALGLLQALELVLVALGEQLFDGLGLLAGNLQTQHFVLELLVPEGIQFGDVLGPGGLLAIGFQAFADAEIELVDALAEQPQGVFDTPSQALEVTGIDSEARLQVAALEKVVEAQAPGIELLDIGGGEVHPRRVQQLQVALVDHLRARIIERRLVVVMALEQLHHVQAGDDLLAIGF